MLVRDRSWRQHRCWYVRESSGAVAGGDSGAVGEERGADGTGSCGIDRGGRVQVAAAPAPALPAAKPV
eukprot:6148096-Prymnesium_polylepis.1